MPKQIKPPASLKVLQRDFGSAISEPFEFGESGAFRCQTERYAPELLAQAEADRVAVYNRQYWFRLLTVMQEEYPLLEQMLGIDAFNQMVSAYLDCYPPDSPSLNDLANHLLEFLAEHEPWREDLAVCQAAELETILAGAFIAGEEPGFDPASLSEGDRAAIGSRVLRLQPYVALFQEEWSLYETRALLKLAEGREAVPSPAREAGWWLLYRDQSGRQAAEALSASQYQLLAALAAGHPLDQAISRVESTANEQDRAQLGSSIQGWFAHWVQLGIWTV